jgi:hypothetical protein
MTGGRSVDRRASLADAVDFQGTRLRVSMPPMKTQMATQMATGRPVMAGKRHDPSPEARRAIRVRWRAADHGHTRAAVAT